MSHKEISLQAASPTDTADLAIWLQRQGHVAVVKPAPGTMGAGDVATIAVSGAAAFRGLMLVAREWVRARRTSITVEIPGRGRIVVEGTTDIDDLLELLGEHDVA